MPWNSTTWRSTPCSPPWAASPAAAVAAVVPDAVAVQVATAVVVAGAGIVLVRGRVSAAFAHHYEGERAPRRARRARRPGGGHARPGRRLGPGRPRPARRRALAGGQRRRRAAPAGHEGAGHGRGGDDAHRVAGRRPPAAESKLEAGEGPRVENGRRSSRDRSHQRRGCHRPRRRRPGGGGVASWRCARWSTSSSRARSGW